MCVCVCVCVCLCVCVVAHVSVCACVYTDVLSVDVWMRSLHYSRSVASLLYMVYSCVSYSNNYGKQTYVCASAGESYSGVSIIMGTLSLLSLSCP